MADIRPVDANELLKESVYCTGPDGSGVYAVPIGVIFAAPTLKYDQFRDAPKKVEEGGHENAPD